MYFCYDVVFWLIVIGNGFLKLIIGVYYGVVGDFVG